MDDPWDEDCSMVPNSIDSRYFGHDVDLVGSPEDAGISMAAGPSMSALLPPYLDTNYFFDWSPATGYPASSQMGDVLDNLADEQTSWMALDAHSSSQATLSYQDQSPAVPSTTWPPGHTTWSPSSPPAMTTATTTTTTTSSNQDDQPQELAKQPSKVTDETITTIVHAGPGTAIASDAARGKGKTSKEKSGKQNRKRHTSSEGPEVAPSIYAARGNGRGKGSGKGSGTSGGKGKRQAPAKDHNTTSVAITHIDPVTPPIATVVKFERQPLSVELLQTPGAALSPGLREKSIASPVSLRNLHLGITVLPEDGVAEFLGHEVDGIGGAHGAQDLPTPILSTALPSPTMPLASLASSTPSAIENGDSAQLGELDSRSRNRIAATRCRVKTKVTVAKLQANDRVVTGRREELMHTVSKLKEEVYTLKEELFRHCNCGCSLIQQYLIYTSHKIVDEAASAYAAAHAGQAVHAAHVGDGLGGIARGGAARDDEDDGENHDDDDDDDDDDDEDDDGDGDSEPLLSPSRTTA